MHGRVGHVQVRERGMGGEMSGGEREREVMVKWRKGGGGGGRAGRRLGD